LVFILALGVVGLVFFPSVSLAQRDPKLADSTEPGSLIVFPKFIKGTVTVDGVVTPQSTFEISVVCPAGATCAANQAVRLHGDWVCPGNARNICKELDFTLTTTVNGTVTFDPSRLGITAPCAFGYLMVWVVDANNQPIKFDGLIGDAVLRNASSSAGAYNGLPIQADPALKNLAPILTPGGFLVFDGGAGHYLGIAGTAISGVRFDRLTAPLINTFLTLATLDVLSNRVNTPTFVDFLFWNAAETPTSTSTDFICFAEVDLTDIDTNLTQESQGTAKGSFFGVASDQTFAARSLVAIVETHEKNAAGVIDREYSYSTYSDSILVPTAFHP
jgi:hypothetical protein